MRKNVTPVQQGIRTVPYGLESEFKAELAKMIKDGIIEKMNGPSSWLNSFVIVRKPSGKLRICLDPKPLNEALIQNYNSHVPYIESVTHRLAGHASITMSKVDVNKGFWHVPLSQDSQSLTAFGTPFGNFKYLRLPMGVNPASKAFQQEMNREFNDLKASLLSRMMF